MNKKGFTKNNSLAPFGRGLGRGANAFTLAEVLITLGVIGVVAAMTLPTLIQNHQKQVTVTKLKKAYSEIYQAVALDESKYGTLETWNFYGQENNLSALNEYFVDNYIFPNLKIVKKCEYGDYSCFAKNPVFMNGGKENYFDSFRKAKLAHEYLTASGYSIFFWVNGTPRSANCFIDINGPQKPNMVGKDIFQFSVRWGDSYTVQGYKLGVLPAGLGKDNPDDAKLFVENTSSCTKAPEATYAGNYCAAAIMLNGWKIPDKYPW